MLPKLKMPSFFLAKEKLLVYMFIWQVLLFEAFPVV